MLVECYFVQSMRLYWTSSMGICISTSHFASYTSKYYICQSPRTHTRTHIYTRVHCLPTKHTRTEKKARKNPWEWKLEWNITYNYNRILAAGSQLCDFYVWLHRSMNVFVFFLRCFVFSFHLVWFLFLWQMFASSLGEYV